MPDLDAVSRETAGRRLIQLGVLLFLLGLLTGFVSPTLAVPRLGLTSHLEGLLNGMFLVIVGLLWPRLVLPGWARAAALVLLVYGTFTNWLTTLLGAAWGAGGRLMPIAAGGSEGTRLQEALVTFGLLSLSFAMVVACVVILWGLSRRSSTPAG